MRGRGVLVLALTMVMAGTGFAEDWGWVRYEASNLGQDRWQYTYEVTNVGLAEPIKEFTIWFDYGLYSNLSIETAEPLASEWDELVIQPEPAIWDDGFYDALGLGPGIVVGETVQGFSVSFDWLGQGAPGPQFYEVVNPLTYETIVSGYTVPEPGMILLLGLGSVLMRRNAVLQRRQ